MLTVRPKIAELNFQLFGRSIHPELFDVCVSRSIVRENYTIDLNVTSDGHVIVFRHGNLVLAEVTAGALHPLPQKRQLICQPIKTTRRERVLHQDRIAYECEFQLDIVPPDTFSALGQQTLQPADCEGLIHRFPSGLRMDFGAISYIHIQAFRRYVQLKTFHTYPDSLTIVKSQSEFRLIDPSTESEELS